MSAILLYIRSQKWFFASLVMLALSSLLLLVARLAIDLPLVVKYGFKSLGSEDVFGWEFGLGVSIAGSVTSLVCAVLFLLALAYYKRNIARASLWTIIGVIVSFAVLLPFRAVVMPAVIIAQLSPSDAFYGYILGLVLGIVSIFALLMVYGWARKVRTATEDVD